MRKKTFVVIKYIICFPIYVLLVIFGFVGGADSRDIWDNISKWNNKNKECRKRHSLFLLFVIRK